MRQLESSVSINISK